MHLMMIVTMLTVAIGVRLFGRFCPYQMSRWQRSLIVFMLPPLLLLMTAIAVIAMGYHGEMLGFRASRFSYCLAVAFLGFAIIRAIEINYQGWSSLQQIKHYPQKKIDNNPVRMIETNLPYSAQVGFWNSELVISHGLLATLDKDHLKAVIAHEQAHAYYHDTFWFFWLGWLKRISFWLPKTNQLWQELLLLREIRADQQAAHTVDPLILAESLLIIAQEINHIATAKPLGVVEATFHDLDMDNRLEERINALFNESDYFRFDGIDWHLMLLILLPLVSIPFHR
ncbi:M56 family metallopeptidase [Crocosphaera sp.]|uniref:M56 family metallopeptidase n=1 Tax=Crocosphaera sp. TaxID=2729996 RepID=UPI003F237430|nr:M48 family metalloprotease [Crocosphaera sp.]